MPTLLFETRDLTFNKQISYPNIKIKEGKVTFLMGESGAGKSSLLKLFTQVMSPTDGVIYYRDRPLENYDSLKLRQEVSLVSQELYLFEGTILENFKLFHEMRNNPMPERNFIEEVAKVCCIDVSLEQSTGTLSGGEKQRVYNAIFLSFLPKVLLLDEPTAALDEKTSHVFLANVIAFCNKRGISLVIVSHDRMLAEAFREDVIMLNKGVH
ncbi:MAG: ATP-binding cassette domain-containing protein [Cellulosilyticaceae bacterium]